MKTKNIVISLLVLGLVSLIIYRIISNKEADQPKGGPQGRIPQVEGVVIKPQYFEDNLQLSGSLEADEQIEVRSEVSGIVQQINFTEGGNVQKGQVLVKINDIDLQAQLSQAKTKEALAAENGRRAKLLLEKEAISQEEFDILNAEYQSAKAQTQFIQSQIQKTIIRAPFSGKIGLRNISQGTYVTPTTVITKLVSSSDLKITFSVPDKYAQMLKVGTELKFTVSGATDKFTAKIYALESEIEQATRTLRVRAITSNKEGKLIPGSFASVELPLSTSEDAIIIPTEAVIPVQGGKKVFVKHEGKVKDVMIETSARTSSGVNVLNGLKAGDTLITTGVMTLRPGSPVNVKVK